MTAIEPVSQRTTAGVSTQTTSGAGALNLNENFDTFLNLLTAQLRNQDPLDPTDPTEFVSQLTQFSQLEQSVAQTAQLEEIAAIQRSASALDGLNFLGREVEAVSDTIALDAGEAAFSYEMAQPGDKAEIRIYDDKDELIATLPAQNTAGRHEITWNGALDKGGAASDGLYRVELVAFDGEEANPAGQVIILDSVKELRFGASGGELALESGMTISSLAILSVKDPAVVPPVTP